VVGISRDGQIACDSDDLFHQASNSITTPAAVMFRPTLPEPAVIKRSTEGGHDTNVCSTYSAVTKRGKEVNKVFLTLNILSD
jgi:hypothetical protein